MNELGKDYIWSELFQHFNAAFLRKVEDITDAITDLYCIRNHQKAENPTPDPDKGPELYHL